MFVCSCNMLTDADLHRAVDDGARRPSEIYESKGCKAQCGNCVPGVVCLLRRALEARKLAVPVNEESFAAVASIAASAGNLAACV